MGTWGLYIFKVLKAIFKIFPSKKCSKKYCGQIRVIFLLPEKKSCFGTCQIDFCTGDNYFCQLFESDYRYIEIVAGSE